MQTVLLADANSISQLQDICSLQSCVFGNLHTSRSIKCEVANSDLQPFCVDIFVTHVAIDWHCGVDSHEKKQILTTHTANRSTKLQFVLTTNVFKNSSLSKHFCCPTVGLMKSAVNHGSAFKPFACQLGLSSWPLALLCIVGARQKS